ncbi:uncharacterized protein V1510DRAFT_405815 [Dipodascopsis tothii]|uniref:uncharacterized protein n=1 Tax=Dipodascopsis tothii TaxID=44089 RepID=UPI0034CFBCB2
MRYAGPGSDEHTNLPVRALRVMDTTPLKSQSEIQNDGEAVVSFTSNDSCMVDTEGFAVSGRRWTVGNGDGSADEDIMNGYNGTVFAYGQTGAGKSYTMMGPSIDDAENCGIIPRIIEQIFQLILQSPAEIEYTVNVSYMEIYMEKVKDLLQPQNDNLPVHEEKSKGVYVKGLSKLYVSSVKEVFDVMRQGNSARSVASTNMNNESSRSHSIFAIVVSQKNLETGSAKSGQLFLVDLAGSEKVGKTGASGIVLEEAKKINKSLSALGMVINALTDGKSTHVPYRDSKLTRILQESLGGNSRTTLIVNCSPSSYNATETLSTLRFGVRAKNIRNKAKINAELSPAELKVMLRKAQAQNTMYATYISQLEGEIESWRGGSSVPKERWVSLETSSKPVATNLFSTPRRQPRTTSSASIASVSSVGSTFAGSSGTGETSAPSTPSRLQAPALLADPPGTPRNYDYSKEEIEDFFKRENDLQDQLNEREQTIANLERTLGELKTEVAALQQQEASAAKSKERLTVDLAELKSQLEQLQFQSKESNISMDELRELNTEITAELDSVKRQLLEASVQVKELSSKLSQRNKRRQSKIDDIMAGLQSFKLGSDASGPVSALLAALEESSVENINPDELKAWCKDVQKFASRTESLLETQIDSFEDQIARRQDIEQQIKTFDGQVQRLLASLGEGVENDEKKAQIAAELEAFVVRRTSVLDSLVDDVKQDLATAVAENSRLRQTVERLNVPPTPALSTSSPTLSTESTTFEAAPNAQVASLPADMNSKSAGQPDDFDTFKKSLMRDLQARCERVAELEITLAEVKESLRTTVKQSTQTSKQQQKRLVILERNLEQLTGVQRHLIEQNQALKKSAAITERKLNAKNERIAGLENMLVEAQERLSSEAQGFETRLSSLHNRLEDVKAFRRAAEPVNRYPMSSSPTNGRAVAGQRIIKPLRGGGAAAGVITPVMPAAVTGSAMIPPPSPLGSLPLLSPHPIDRENDRLFAAETAASPRSPKRTSWFRQGGRRTGSAQWDTTDSQAVTLCAMTQRELQLVASRPRLVIHCDQPRRPGHPDRGPQRQNRRGTRVPCVPVVGSLTYTLGRSPTFYRTTPTWSTFRINTEFAVFGVVRAVAYVEADLASRPQTRLRPLLQVVPRIIASSAGRRRSSNQLFPSSPNQSGFMFGSEKAAVYEAVALSPSTSSPAVTDLLTASMRSPTGVIPPVTAAAISNESSTVVTLELKDGTLVQGYSFGANKSVAGEFVFQTGMVGYPESITDPSYQGQILVITFPLVGNYGVPSRETRDPLIPDLPMHFESNKIHIAGLVVCDYTEQYSHYLATSSLGQWLKEQNIPAVYGVDTRALTKLIRQKGSMLGRMLFPKAGSRPSSAISDARFTNQTSDAWRSEFETIEWEDPNLKNLVVEVSITEPKIYYPDPATARKRPDGKTLRIICIDVGMKFNQIRCFVRRGVELKVVPYDHDILSEEDYDGLFVSNGPGDPAAMTHTIEALSVAIQQERTPIFGICLGHQLLSRAIGAQTVKLKFGNRGHNIPCTNLINGRCYITSQNHGYAVDVSTLPAGYKELFVNANDGSNEGMYNTTKPIFSVQFHPESTPGPRDTEWMFDTFIDSVYESAHAGKLVQIKIPGGTAEEALRKNPPVHVKKVLVLGSGGLSIGQAGEFDYSGSQAIKALKEEGIYTVLINPNIATIQTSKGLADKVYFLPVTPDFVRKVIIEEKVDAIYVTFGGQTALNVGIKLKDEFESLGVKVLGTPIDTIITTEDRELFARSMEEIGEKCAKSASASNLQEAVTAVKDIGFPVIVRAAYALGGLGSGFAENMDQLIDLCNRAFASSPQVLIERSMKGWKEIEYEVVRDCNDNCITVCNMENFDPLGIHTGDSIVIAPSQTLSDEDYNMLRTTAVNVIRHLGVVGECNIQYALNPFSKEYCIIEVNARLSRSSALASKATGYPLAFVAAKLGLNIPLNKIKNAVTKVTCACFEPSLDYVVVKIPRWDLKKFTRVSTELSSSMKSVGEVMSIGRTFEEAIQKAIRAIDYHNLGFNATDALMSIDIDTELQTPSDQRLFALANAMYSGKYSVDKIWQMTKIDKWFLNKLENLIKFGQRLSSFNTSSINTTLMRQAKQLGFDDRQLAKFLNSNEFAVRQRRIELGVTPFVKQIDTVAAEFPCFTNYLYVTYNACEHDISFNDHGVMVLGSGVYRIGSSVEFDWCAVRAVRTLREQKIKTVMVNYNPETVSTDYDEADKLYFESLNLERVLDIYQLERSGGVIVSMGGQTSNNIALSLKRENVKILGTSPEMIDGAENRYKFSRMLDRIGVDQPAWKELTSTDEASDFCEKVGYPVLVRPSYVLSGAAMNTVYSRDDLANYLQQAVEVSRDYPVVITKYIENAKEIEMDAVAKDGKMLMHVVSEHVENAGVHSGDATLIVPPQDLDPETVRRIEVATEKIGNALNVSGPFNIQFIAKDNEIKVIECNVRASRSFPFVSKALGVDLIELATKAIVGLPVEAYPEPDQPIPKDYCAVKVPQFSFSRLAGADPVLGVEMASTGEVAAFGHNKYEAYLKALIATGFRLPKKNILLSIGSFKEKMELLPSVRKLHEMGFSLFATAGTADFIQEHGIPVKYLEVLDGDSDQKSEYSLTQHLANNLIDLYINLPSSNKFRRPASYMSRGYQTRRMAVDYSVPLVTNVKNAKLLIEALALKANSDINVTLIDSMVDGIVGKGLVSAVEPEEEEILAPIPSKLLDMFAKATINRQPSPPTSDLLRALRTDNPFLRQHVLSVKTFNRSNLHLLFSIAQEMKLGVLRHGILNILSSRLICTLFYEPSTRTSSSFDAAMQRLGGRVISVTTGTSSVVKGETLQDTVRTLASYSDAIVIRHPSEESAAIAAKYSPVPIINAGNGSLEHPTQALLDLFTIREELGSINGITVTFMGDLKYGRTVHSLCTLLKHYQVRVQLVAPPQLALPEEYRAELAKAGMILLESTEVTPEIMAQTDVLYCTRVQKERFSDLGEFERLKDTFIVDNEMMKHAKVHMCVMHPLPRNNEISEELDFDHRAAYFRQMKHGLYVRMALLALVIGPDL